MIVWDILNSVGRLGLTIVAIVLITRYRDMLSWPERVGLGMAGAGSFLTIAVIWERTESPMDGWATSVLTYGALLAWGALAWRKHVHTVNNERHIRQAEEWMVKRHGN